MENNEKIDIKNGDTKYKEVKINKMIVNGKEQDGNIISVEDSKEKSELNVTVYTQEIDTQEIDEQEIDTQEIDVQEIDTQEMDTQEVDIQEVDMQEVDMQEVDTQEIDIQEIETKEIDSIQKKRKGISMIHELFKKGIFHRKRN